MCSRLALLGSVAATLAVGTGCASLGEDDWWIHDLVPDSPCYRVDLMDGVDESSTAELHDLYACVDQNGLVAPLDPLNTDLDDDTRIGAPIGLELAGVLNHLPEVDVDPFAIGDVLLEALESDDRPVDELLGLATEAIYGWQTAAVTAGDVAVDDPSALDAGLLAPMSPVIPVAATALLLDPTGAVDFAGDVLADPETDDWIRTVSSVCASEDPAVSVPLDPLMVDLGYLIKATRTPGNDRWDAASGDSLRDVATFFVVRDNPVIDQISPAVGDMLGDPVVLDALVPMIDDLAAGDHLVPLPPEVGWLAEVDTDGGPLQPGEPSALDVFVRLLAENNHDAQCRTIGIPWTLPNLSVATLELVADMEPGQVESMASIIGSLDDSLLGDLVGQVAFDVALSTCPSLSPTAYDDLSVLETLQQPETADVLVAFVDLLNVLKHGQSDHIPAFADMAEELYDAGGLDPAEELIRDVAREPALTDVLTVLPVLVHPEDHGITAGDAPANDLEDLLGIVQWFFVVDPETELTGFRRTQPWMAPVLGEDGTWVAVGNLARTLADPERQLSQLLDLVPRLVDLDPDLVLVGQIATVLHDDELSQPLLRIAERPAFVDDLLADAPAADATTAQPPLAFVGDLVLSGALEDVLTLVDLVLGSVSTGSTTSAPTAPTTPTAP